MAKVSSQPDFVVCIDCETPCYEFEWKGSDIVEAQCLMCGNENPDVFATQEDFDAMMS